MKNRILHLFNIRTDEAWTVKHLFFLQFFQGAGIAIFNIAAFTVFLEKFPITTLPYVYIFSAVMLWIAGYVYSKIEHSLPLKKLVPYCIVFISVSMLALRFGIRCSDHRAMFFLLLAWYYVIYLISNLEFWGLASLMFDTRQSKRLFGMIGAGDVPSKLIGYSAVPFLIQFLGSENLLFISAATVLCSLFFYRKLETAGKLDIHLQHEHHPQAAGKVSDFVQAVFGSRLVAALASLSFFVITCATIVGFTFYAEVKHEAHTDQQLASFIAIFFALGRIAAIVIRLLLTGRIASIIGTRGSLLLSPLALLVILTAILTSPTFSTDVAFVLYLFGIMTIITEVLKTALQDPIFLTLMQPLPTHLRLKGHTVVKGIMDPFALAFSGLLLVGMIHFSGNAPLMTICYILVAIIGVWLVLIFVVHKEYLQTVLVALNKRYLYGTELDIKDEHTAKVLEQKIKTGEAGEAMYALNLIERNYSAASEPLLLTALQHPEKVVVAEAVRFAERKKIAAALPRIEQLIAENKEGELLFEAVKARYILLPDESEDLEVYNADPMLMKYAIIGLIKNGGINAIVTGGQKLLQFIGSERAEERKMAASIIGELGVHSFYKPLVKLLDDSDSAVVKAAILATGNVKSPKLLETIEAKFFTKQYEKAVLIAYQTAGAVSLVSIKHLLQQPPLTLQQTAALLRVCGTLRLPEANLVLENSLFTQPTFQKNAIMALHSAGFWAKVGTQEPYLNLIHHYLDSALHLLALKQCLEAQKNLELLAAAIELELSELQDSLLLLFSFVFDNEMMLKARSGIQFNKKESTANAFELIELALPHDISFPFIKIFEHTAGVDKYHALRAYLREHPTVTSAIEDILYNQTFTFNRWTKAVALFSLNQLENKETNRWMDDAKNSADVLVKQIAVSYLTQHN